jgi:hypothetical protein
MEKLDRLGWAAEKLIVSHGVRIGVRANTAEALAGLQEYLPPDHRASRSEIVDRLNSVRAAPPSRRPGVRGYHLLYAGASRLARVMDLQEAYRLMESDLHLYVAEKAPRRIFVHAGVVAWKGRAIVIPGRSFSGKSTLVAALVKAGATYYSDEFAVFDDLGRVHPFARPLSLRQPGDAPALRCPVEALGGRAGRKPLPLGLVVLSEYREGARWRPRSLTAGEAMLGLLSNTVPARGRPAASLATLSKAIHGTPALKSKRGEAEEIIEFLLRRCMVQ